MIDCHKHLYLCLNTHHDWEEDGGLLEGLDEPERDEAEDLDHREHVHSTNLNLNTHKIYNTNASL